MKRLALTLFALAAACGGSSGPTAPGPVAAMQAGTWVGILEVTSCGSSAYGCRTGGLEDFTLRLAADGRGVAQLIPRGGTPFGVDITSARQADGSWIATGALTAPDFDRSRIDAQIVLSQIDPASLTGTVTYTFTAREGAHTRSARILTSRAVNAVLPGRLHGTWIGFIERTSCTGTCESGYFAGSEFELAISHVQSSLIGTMSLFGAFTAQSSGNGFTVSLSRGTPDNPACQYQYDGVTCYIEISNLTVSTDALDRMQGTFNYRLQEYLSASRYVSMSGTARLVGVVRWP